MIFKMVLSNELLERRNKKMARNQIIIDWAKLPSTITVHEGYSKNSSFNTYPVEGYFANYHGKDFYCKCGHVTKQTIIGDKFYCEGCKKKVPSKHVLVDSEHYFDVKIICKEMQFHKYSVRLQDVRGELHATFEKYPQFDTITSDHIFNPVEERYAIEYINRINETTCDSRTKQFFTWMKRNNYWTDNMSWEMKQYASRNSKAVKTFVCDSLDLGFPEHILCMLLCNGTFTRLCVANSFSKNVTEYIPENITPITEKIAKGQFFVIYDKYKRAYNDLLKNNNDEFGLVINYYMSNLINDEGLTALLEHPEIFNNPNFTKFIKKYYSQISGYINCIGQNPDFNSKIFKTDSLDVKSSCYDANVRELINTGYTEDQIEESFAASEKNDTLSMLINLTSMRKKKIKA